MVDPFMLNTDNMTRIESFTLYLPRRATFTLQERRGFPQPSLKTHLVFNDYLLFDDSHALCLPRNRDSLGHSVKGDRITVTEAIPVKADKKAALTNVNKDTLKTQRQPQKQEQAS